MLLGVKTMSGLRHGRRAAGPQHVEILGAVEGWQICMLSSAASCMKLSAARWNASGPWPS